MLAITEAGISIVHVNKQDILLGVMMSAVTMGLYYEVIPYTHRLLRDMVFNDAEELIYTMLRKHGMINNGQLPYRMFVKGVQGKKLINPIIKRKAPDGNIDIVA